MSRKRPVSEPIDLTSDTPSVSRRCSSSGSSSSGGGTIDLTSPTRTKDTAGDGDYAAWLASRCESCESATANPGYPYCTGCYEQRRPAVAPYCTGCFTAPANPGFSLCENCFQASRAGSGAGGARPCSRCGVARANPGYEWCTRCYIAQRLGHAAGLGGGGGGGGGGFGGMAAAASAAPPENATYEELLEWEQAP